MRLYLEEDEGGIAMDIKTMEYKNRAVQFLMRELADNVLLCPMCGAESVLKERIYPRHAVSEDEARKVLHADLTCPACKLTYTLSRAYTYTVVNLTYFAGEDVEIPGKSYDVDMASAMYIVAKILTDAVNASVLFGLPNMVERAIKKLIMSLEQAADIFAIFKYAGLSDELKEAGTSGFYILSEEDLKPVD